MQNDLNKVLEYIEDNIHLDIHLSDIANYVNYSESYLSRKFNSYVNMSIKEYINKRRLAKIAQMIKYTKKSIEYIAHYFGFNSSKYFSTVFKQEFGISPSTYRKDNVFIYLQPKRILKGGTIMVKECLDELMYYINFYSSNQNELLDTIASLDNCILNKQNNSDIELVTFTRGNDNDYVLCQIDLNLINCKYLVKPIYSTQINKDVIISSIEKIDNKVYVSFRKTSSNKEIKAKLYDIPISKVQITTITKKELESNKEKESYLSWVDKIQEVKEHINDILKLPNNIEIDKYLSTYDDIITLKAFNKEYVLIKLVQTKIQFGLYSIYINMEDKYYE